MNPINIIIPLGGKGERFSNNGYTIPKALIPIYGKPMIFHVLDNLQLQQFDKLIIVYNAVLDDHGFATSIANKYPSVILLKLTKQTSGAAETVREGISMIGFENMHKKTLLLDCDTIYTIDIVSQFRIETSSVVFYTVKPCDTPPIYSYILMDNSNKIIDIAEKVKISNNANTGAYGFVSAEQLYKYCQNNVLTYNNEPYTSCVIKTMLSDCISFYGKELDPNAVFSVGTPIELTNYLNSSYAYLFDLDGTLVITDNIYFEVWSHILKLYGGTLTHDIFKKYIQGNSDKYVLQTLLPNVEFKDGELSALKDSLFMQNITKIESVKGSIDFLKRLRYTWNPLCIVTNCNKSVANGILKYLEIDHLIDFVVSSETCANNKPSPDPYYYALNKFDVKSDRAIIFEDSKTGILSGKSVQPKCLIGVGSIYSSDELIAYGANIAITDFTENIMDKIVRYDVSFEKKIKEWISRDYGETICIDSNKLKGGFIADVIKVCINNTTECVFKLENNCQNALSLMANQLQLYDREYYFYEIISKYLKNIRVPKYIGLVRDNNYKSIGILLENLYVGQKCVPNLNLNVVSADVSLQIINKMAILHSQFWNKPLKRAFPLLKSTRDSCFYPFCKDYIFEKWSIFVNKWNKVLTKEQIEIGEKIKNEFENIQIRLSNINTTLLHGDIKSPNIFYDLENMCEPIFLDWQHCSIGKGVQDLAFFIVESFDINKIDILLPLFKNYYYCKLVEYGIQNYSFSEFEIDLCDAFCYIPFFTAVWFGCMSEDELIDKNFPFFFIQKLFKILVKFI
jgi:HAD superfamily hydrolase (TIGR01509 family)